MSQKSVATMRTHRNTVRSGPDSGFFPDGFAAAAGQLGYRLAAGFLAAVGAGLAIALVSYSREDPSFNQASDLAPQNWLGAPGALASDLSLQMSGMAAALVPLFLFAWAWRLYRDHRWSGLRLLFAIPALLLAATGLGALPAPGSWPLATGIGGVLGDLNFQLCLDLTAIISGKSTGSAELISWIVAPAALIAGIFATIGALGLHLSEWRAIGLGIQKITRLLLRIAFRTSRTLYRATAGLFAHGNRGGGRAEPQWHNAHDIEAAPAPVSLSPATPAHAIGDFAEDIPAPPTIMNNRPAPPSGKAKPAKRGSADADARQGVLAFDTGQEGDYTPPGLELLASSNTAEIVPASTEEELFAQARQLESVLQDYGVKGQIIKVHPGPVVTLFELEPAPGTKTNRVISLSDDIARSMAAISVRIATVPGRNVIGIELPNKTRESVFLSDLLADPSMRNQSGLYLAIGKDIGGKPVAADLARMPHLLIAGTTGSGKSVGINAMILSLLYRLTPQQCRLIMIDPKMLELSVYDDIPHLLTPVVTDPQKAVVALKWTVKEMERRYADMMRLGVRNISGYNHRVREAEAKGEHLTRAVQTGFDHETGRAIYEEQPLDLQPMPSIVVVVDEMADLMMVAGKEIEVAIQRLAQMARAAGIHLIMATQRPSVDVITGTIKANFPVRMSFQVTSKIDSRTILGEQGAEQLLGQGDMLFTLSGGRIRRVHGPFVSDTEVERVVTHLKQQAVPDYLDAILDDEEGGEGDSTGDGSAAPGSGDILYDRAIDLVARNQKASTSFLQRHLQIGYNRAATLIERMEDDGIVGRANHVGKREVFVRRPDEDF